MFVCIIILTISNFPPASGPSTCKLQNYHLQIPPKWQTFPFLTCWLPRRTPVSTAWHLPNCHTGVCSYMLEHIFTLLLCVWQLSIFFMLVSTIMASVSLVQMSATGIVSLLSKKGISISRLHLLIPFSEYQQIIQIPD